MIVLLIPLASASTWVSNSSNFNDGTYKNTFLSGSFVKLNATYNNGSYTSEIFDGGLFSDWNSISWITNAFGALPNNNQRRQSRDKIQRAFNFCAGKKGDKDR